MGLPVQEWARGRDGPDADATSDRTAAGDRTVAVGRTSGTG